MNPIPQEVLDDLASKLNFQSFTDDETLIAYANEMADPQLTAEREAEIAELLPKKYTQKVNATAEETEDKILVPKILIVNAFNVKQGPQATDGWQTSVSGRKRRRPKEDVAVGVHVSVDNDYFTSVTLKYLWAPLKK